MARTAVIKLGGVDYTVHAFNMGELRRVATIFNKAKANGGGEGVEVAFDVLRIAFERAEPKADVETVEPESFDEVISASRTLLELAGLQKTEENPPQGQAAP